MVSEWTKYNINVEAQWNIKHITKYTLWQRPRRMAYFLRSRAYSSFHFQPNLLFKKTSSHLFLRLWSSPQLTSLFSSGNGPSKIFKHEATEFAMSFTSSTAAITAWSMCLNARTTISCIHRDCICGSLSESSTWNTATKKKKLNCHVQEFFYYLIYLNVLIFFFSMTRKQNYEHNQSMYHSSQWSHLKAPSVHKVCQCPSINRGKLKWTKVCYLITYKDDKKLQHNSKHVSDCCKTYMLPILAGQYHRSTCVPSQSIHRVTAHRSIKSEGTM